MALTDVTPTLELTLTHPGPVLSVQYSPDGTRLATTGGDGTARIWDSTTKGHLTTLTGHTDAVTGIAYSPDGTRLATASDDRTARIWDSTTGIRLATLTGHKGRVTGVAYHPDGTRLATAGDDGTARIWDATTGDHLATLAGHTRGVTGVAYHPAGTHLATTGTDGTARIWAATTGDHLVTLAGHTRAVTGIAYHPDGTRLATSSGDGTARIWDAVTGERLVTLTGHTGPVTGVAYHPDGTHLATTSWDGTARLWDASTGDHLATLTGHTNTVTGVAYDPYLPSLATVSWDGTARIWNATTGLCVFTLTGHTDPVYSASFHPSGTRIATASWANSAHIWDAVTGDYLNTLVGHTRRVHAVAYSPTGARLATASGDYIARTWDAATGQSLAAHRGHTAPLTGVNYSPDGAQFATSSLDRTASIWETDSGQQLMVLRGHKRAIRGVTYSPDGAHLATASWDQTARVWDAVDGNHLMTLEGHEGRVYAVSYSSDSAHLATGSADHTARIWEAASGEHKATLIGHTGTVAAVSFSPDGSRLATASWDNTVRIWDPKTGGQLVALTGHTRAVTAVAYSPDGSHLATASIDGTARIWRVAQTPHTGTVLSLDDVDIQDAIGRQVLAGHLRGVVDQMLDRGLTGSVQSLDGRWGSGKSVLARLTLKRMTTPRTPTPEMTHPRFHGDPVVVWFNAWREAQQSPHWWALASQIRSKVAAHRDIGTQGAMTLTLGLRRLTRSSAVRMTVLIAVALAFLWAKVPFSTTLDTTWRWVQTALAILAALFVLSRFLFWFSPTFGRLHERTDDNPLGEVADMVRDIRRWSPRHGTNHRQAGALATLALTGLGALALRIGIAPPTVHGWPRWLQSTTDPLPVLAVAAAIGLLAASTVRVLPRTVRESKHVGEKSPRDQGPLHSRLERALFGLAMAALVVVVAAAPAMSEWRAGWPDWLVRAPGSLIALAVLAALVFAALALWLNSTLDQPRRPIVLVLDELDRCEATTVAGYLETVHTILSPLERGPHRPASWLDTWRAPAPLIVFVLADGRWVRQAFTTKFKDFEGLGSGVRTLGADFLQKLFDHTVLVPPLGDTQAGTMVRLATGPGAVPTSALASGAAGVSAAAGPRSSHPEGGGSAEGTSAAVADASGRDSSPNPAAQASSRSGGAVPDSSARRPATQRRAPGAGTERDALEARQADAEAAARASEADASLAALERTEEHLLAQYVGIVPNNPRLIRRVANCWGMLKAIRKHLNTKAAGVDDDALVRAAVLFVAFPTVVDQLLDAVSPPVLLDTPGTTSPSTLAGTGAKADGAAAAPSPWSRPDVLHVLRRPDGTYLDTTTLALCYGHTFPPPIPLQPPAPVPTPVQPDPPATTAPPPAAGPAPTQE